MRSCDKIKSQISHNTMPVVTKLVYLKKTYERRKPLKIHGLTFVTWQFYKSISPLSQDFLTSGKIIKTQTLSHTKFLLKIFFLGIMFPKKLMQNFFHFFIFCLQSFMLFICIFNRIQKSVTLYFWLDNKKEILTWFGFFAKYPD